MADKLIVTQCSKQKSGAEMFPNTEYSILSVLPDMYKDLLITSRKLFEHVIYGRNNVSALSMYNGYEYQVLEKLLIHSLFLKRKNRFHHHFCKIWSGTRF